MLCLIYLLACLFAASYECAHYEENRLERSVNSGSGFNCDKTLLDYKIWYRFVTVGNEMIPLQPPESNRCKTHAAG